MKTIIAAVILFAIASCAPAADNDKKKAEPASRGVTIPKDAVASPDGVHFSYTDKQGKKWIYSKSPFGVIRNQVQDAPAATPASNTAKAIDKGDTVRFERPGPFGTVSWEKKKSELTDEERQIIASQNAREAQNASDAQNAKAAQDSKNAQTAKTEKND